MTDIDKEYLWTIHPEHKDGVKMKAVLYRLIRDFILETLATEGEIDFHYFLDKVHSRFVPDLGDHTGWLLYHVKLDLEARGLIQHDRSKKRGDRSAVVKLLLRSQQRHRPMNRTTQLKNTTNVFVNNSVKSKFIELFRTQPMIVNSPGRINLIGEHTDYNNGYVMPAAINKGIQMALAKSAHERSLVYAIKYDEFFTIDLSNPAEVSSPEWANYLLGIVAQLHKRELKIENFNCVFDGDLPTGAGLSSSAAMECGFVFGLNELFKLKLSKLDMVHIAQWSEHNYVGVKCGIMDQFASLMSRENQVMVLDCQWLNHKYFPLDLGGYSILLCNTNVKHSLASSEYNTRREECEEGVQIIKKYDPEINSLRDVSLAMLSKCKDSLPSKVYNRCLYVVEENMRVLQASHDLQNGKLASFGEKMFATHRGLSQLYKVSCPELDFLVDKAKEFEGILGARMMGGGFGGCTINIIHQDVIENFLKATRAAYRAEFGIELTSFIVETANGTSVLETIK
jgi:galactokinase